jgi:uncharacterized membrane protein/predicted DsbA family dithiol-disulfide isomerase
MAKSAMVTPAHEPPPAAAAAVTPPPTGTLERSLSLAPVVTGLAASAAMLVDYLRPIPVFCAEGGGCDAIRHTPYATPLGIPLPFYGLGGFLVLGTVVLLPGARARFLQLGLAAMAGLAGTLLLMLQLMLGHLCPYCCVADASGVVSLLMAAWWVTRPSIQAGWGPLVMRVAGPAALVLGVVAPIVLGLFLPVSVPDVIQAEIARTPRGQVTVVDFVDFECPFCRATQSELEPVLEAHKGQLRLVRRQVPLHSHPHAHDAARAACCGDKLGKGSDMAASLFATDVEQLTPEGCQKLAEALGIPAEAYRACVADPSTDASIEADYAEFKSAGGYALPTIWIGRHQMVGARSREDLAKALEDELKASGG